MPDLGRIDPMPVAPLAAAQKEINTSACGVNLTRMNPGLPIPAALGVRAEAKEADDFVCGHAVKNSGRKRGGN